MKYKHIFGPVLSRRLGISLGVDLVVHKVCSLDCIYCECGKTTDLTLKQKEYVRFSDIKTELDHYWAYNDDPDYITFSGSGEPTLNVCLKQVIEYIKMTKPHIQVAVLTNATQMDDPAVREAMMKADRVIPSLDAVGSEIFQMINRPHSDVDLERMICGIEIFSSQFKGELFLEVFILPDINDKPADIKNLSHVINKIKPDKVQINTLDRPGTCSGLRPATRIELLKIIEQIDYEPMEIIARVDQRIRSRVNREDIKTAILETIHRRPSTKNDLVQTLGVEPKHIQGYIEQLEKENLITSEQRERGRFYRTIK